MLIPKVEPVYNSMQYIASSSNAPLRDLSFGRLRLTKPFRLNPELNTETALMFLTGTADIHINHLGFEHITWRSVGPGGHTPISGSSDMVLFSGRTTVDIVPPLGMAVDVAVIQAKTETDDTMTVLIREQDALSVEMHPASGHYARTVKTYLGDDGPSSRIRCGVTVNRIGHASSFPQHSFEIFDDIQGFEEVFQVMATGGTGEVLQRQKGYYVNGEHTDDVLLMRTGDVCVVPCGPHWIIGAPETQVAYLWAYISQDSRVTKRPPQFLEDRLHA